jgi:predicted tellurium resistance membrane protein TerC
VLELFSQPETYISLLTLTLLEIVLGIDNIIFISIIAGKLPKAQQNRTRIIGLLLAVIGRLGLLTVVSWLAQLNTPLFAVFQFEFTGKSLVLLFGGLFLVWKSAQEIYEKVEGNEHGVDETPDKPVTVGSVILQILFVDLVFSLDSIITAVGMVPHVPIIVIAIVISLGVMIWASAGIADFIEAHPSVKVLALSFLMMIGTLLIAESFHYHIPKGYIYFSLAFSMLTEMINIRVQGLKKKNA